MVAAAPTRVRLPHRYDPRPYQLPFLRAFPHKKRRAVWVVRRRAGKDITVWSAVVIPEAVQTVGRYYYLFPTYGQARSALWEGLDNEGIPFMSRIPRELMDGDPNESRMSIRLINGSIIQLAGSDNYNHLVGGNVRGLVFSEWSLCQPGAWDYLQPMIASNGGWAAFLYTPRGRNHGYDFLQTARRYPGDWFHEVLTVEDTGEMRPGELAEVRAGGMSEERIQQEYYCDFEVGNEGSYYGRLMAEARAGGRIGMVPHDPALKVHTVWDVGVSDHTVIGFVQVKGNAIYAIDYYANHGEGFDHYQRVIEGLAASHGYRYGVHIGPHDIAQRSKNDGKTYQDYALDRRFRFTVLPPASLDAGIEATRSVIPRIYFNAATTERWVSHLEAYSKAWNEALQVWSDRPRHDASSHPADMTRYLAQAEKAGLLRDQAPALPTPKAYTPGYARMGR